MLGDAVMLAVGGTVSGGFTPGAVGWLNGVLAGSGVV